MGALTSFSFHLSVHSFTRRKHTTPHTQSSSLSKERKNDIRMKQVIFFAALLTVASASCPDSCSGHGTCGTHDKCSCFARWGGSNCADRQCPSGLSWVVSNGGSNIPAGDDLGGKHAYTECSSQGTCNTETGECECFPGYEGRGCRRTSCPNKCSGHGRCVYNDDLVSSYGMSGYMQFDSQYWDAHKTRQCVCDAEYEGIDCSSRQCPKGDDPLTECVNSDSPGESNDMTQVITFPTTDGSFAAGFFTLTFSDQYGGEWATYPISLSAPADNSAGDAVCTAVGDALEELPNFAIPNATSTRASDHSAAPVDLICNVKFVDPANSGEQYLLVPSDASTDHDLPGMQPRFASFAPTSASITVTEQTLAAGDEYKEHSECSNRGICDHSNGVCGCFAGYTGESCNIQTVFF